MGMTGGLAKGSCDMGRTEGTGGINHKEEMRVIDGISAVDDFDSVGYWAKDIGGRSTCEHGEINGFAILGVLLLSPPDTDQRGFGVSRRR